MITNDKQSVVGKSAGIVAILEIERANRTAEKATLRKRNVIGI
jgi:hypothetical protein